MKKLKIVVLTVMVFGVMNVFASNEKKETFKVSGNCGMCEKTIETAAKSVDGVIKADWDKEKKVITVSFDDAKTDLISIHKAIAQAGYDTEKVKAKEETYSKLPGCCQYERKSTKMMKDHSGYKH